jgi:hypothetical protein
MAIQCNMVDVVLAGANVVEELIALEERTRRKKKDVWVRKRILRRKKTRCIGNTTERAGNGRFLVIQQFSTN